MRGGKCLIALVIVALSATQATAAGFRLPEAGAKAMGMGFAFTAQANDPSAIYFNPAGLTQLDGMNVMLGATYIRENGATFTGTTPLTGGATVSETQKDLDFIVPNAYFTMKATPALAFGVGVFTPFGLGQEYENRNTSIFRNQVTKIDLQTIVVNPTIAWKVNEYFSVGAGIDYLWGRAKLARTPVNLAIGDNSTSPPTNNLYNSELEADGDAWGYNFGVLVALTKDLKLGLSHRSGFHLDLKDADVDLSNISTSGRAGLGAGSVSSVFFAGATTFHTGGSATIELPATTALGLAYTSGRITLEADLDYTWWHSFRNLRIEITDQKSPVLVTSDTDENWKDVVAFRFGGEYRVTDPLALRLGFAYDPTPVPARTMSPLLPDADRLNYMVGAGYKHGNWTVDASYFYVDKKDRRENNQTATSPTGTPGTGFNGKWTGDAHLVALDVGYRF